ncbi:MAG TPA: hypothetical protein VLT32_07900 [Candidatus Sulfomarinibacteraceae bacterium]|nr:hypothetical protein [Candidatus Sulfomarinibacteraceae bacterium]
MRPTTLAIAIAIAVLGLGCAGTEGPETEAELAAEIGPGEPASLETPFTAEEIRDEWVEGLEITVRRWTPSAEAFESWAVVAADNAGVDIAAVRVDADGAPVGEPAARHSTWAELRDHAAFPADLAVRERMFRETPLGRFEGWLYTVDDPSSGTVNEFFFAESLPGAPLQVRVLRDGEVVEIFEQVERSRPE